MYLENDDSSTQKKRKSSSYIANGNINDTATAGNSLTVLQTLNIELSYDPAILLLCIYIHED